MEVQVLSSAFPRKIGRLAQRAAHLLGERAKRDPERIALRLGSFAFVSRFRRR